MAQLSDIVRYCDERVRRSEIADFDGAENGLQVQNNGNVTRIGAAVDAGIEPFRAAVAAGVDFLIVHHGLYWTPPQPLVGRHYTKVKVALDGNLAVYGAHLPLDAHPEIGNNALLARDIGLTVCDWFIEYEGTPIAAIAECPHDRAALRARLQQRFGADIRAIEYGGTRPARVAVLTGSGRSALSRMRELGIDTLITGELRQEHFNLAQEEGFNLYVCGHYATETYGVKALAAELAQHFGLPWTFIETPCPL